MLSTNVFLLRAALALSLLLSTIAFAASAVPMPLTIRTGKGNADHGSMIFGYSWRTPVGYDENAPVECTSAASETASQCYVTLDVSGITSNDATDLLVRVKAKAFANASNAGPAGYCQVAVASTNELALANNYFIHAEAQGSDQAGAAQRRNVDYTEATVPVDHPTLKVTKEIIGECEIELAVYLQGQIVQRSMLAQLIRNVLSALPDEFASILRQAL